MDPVEDSLANTPLFESLPAEEWSRLARAMTVIEMPAGMLLFREGDPSDYFYVLLEGRVEIVKAFGTPEELVLGVRDAGDFIGEMGLLNQDRLRTATVRTRKATRCLLIPADEFNTLLSRFPAMVCQMASVLSARTTLAENDTIRALREKNRQLAQAYQELQAAQTQLVEKEKLEHELQLAREIQRGLLTAHLPYWAGYDFGALMVPARAVGGDFFSIFAMDEERMALVVGDVMGKGVPAAIFMAQAHALLRATAGADLSPGETLRRVNRWLLKMNDRELFVTLVYGILHRTTGVFEYARAGHELPLLMSQAGQIRFAPAGEGMPLGILHDLVLDESRLILSPGELLLLYSDGVTDGSDGAGNYFGPEGLTRAVGAASDQSAQLICRSVLQAVSDFQGSEPQFDDITLLAVRRE
jgi:serine phosphatase RsbU (regulator of sigma subunit)